MDFVPPYHKLINLNRPNENAKRMVKPLNSAKLAVGFFYRFSSILNALKYAMLKFFKIYR
ncbi:hypothetical protein [Campylobacter curvus]|uniref:hypothetical protein n=1 Tax=Campylobacter curvus TaxID=200 RepID=UPI0001593BDC|nr:hypothetical protein [Campylobacter curvus]EJP75978.1 hypothetical protein HMPREF1139_1734 [Campylobacter sp. FOBRC14]